MKTHGAILVAAGIFLSRIAGFLRVSVFAHYFGNSAAADAFNAAMRIPNFLQNLFGEGVLSASFIPVYAALDAEGRKAEARQVATSIAAILSLLVSLLVLLGILATPLLIDLIAPGFEGERRELAIELVRIFFPGTGLLVMSAWCLGVLNSHRRFFLSYAAPVVWNGAIIAALLVFGGRTGQDRLAIYTTWGVVVGSLLQFLIQLPSVLRLLGRGGLNLTLTPAVREVVANFLPVVLGRGVVQVSAYVDSLLASLLPAGAVSALGYAQMLYLLPVSLFGMSVSAAELPEMSSTTGTNEEVQNALQEKLERGLGQIAFFVVPSTVAFLLLGDVLVAALLESGQFRRADSVYVWATLAGSAVGLLAVTLGRLYASTFYALKDTRTPLKYAAVRVTVSILAGVPLALYAPEGLGLAQSWGVVGITLASSLGGWTEYALLRTALSHRIGKTAIAGLLLKLLFAAGVAGTIGWILLSIFRYFYPIVKAIFVFLPFGIVYLVLTTIMGVSQVSSLLAKVRRITRI